MSKNIKVAFFVYPSAFQNVGGGEILLLKTKEYLERLGLYVKLFDIWNDKLEDFDILHIFGAIKDCLGLMQTAKNKNLKIVLTPVFFSTLQRALHEYGTAKRKLNACMHHLAKVVFPNFPSDKRKMLLLADAIISSSKIEKSQLTRLFNIDKARICIIPNCVDKNFEYGNKDTFIAKHQVKDFVLSVGRIEPRKNQLNLIKALKGFPEPLVVIGGPVSDYLDYYNECRRQADKNVLFIDSLNHDDAMLKSAYSACRCFVSQGWFETPGLAALEAAFAGVNVASTNKGCTKEYFKDFVEYFDPSNIRDMRKAIENAFHKEKTPLFKEYIKNHFLWDIAAKKNIDLYSEILKK